MLNDLRPKITTILSDVDTTLELRLQNICKLLKDSIPYYNWVGFYFNNGDKEELKLGPFAGEPTEHTIIPFGKGICGQVAISNKNFLVPDVSAQDNYIACNLNVKSELVVPLFSNGINIGQIDIDSNTPDPFTDEDVALLEFINAKVAKYL
jgi:GAF domain-containing protein